MAVIPPWIDVKPSDFAAAAGKGLALGVERTDIAQRAATAQAEMVQRAAIAKQQLDQQAQMAAMQAKIRAEQQQKANDMEQQKIQIGDAYHQQMTSLAKQKLQQSTMMDAAKLDAIQRNLALKENAAKKTPKVQTAKLGNELFQYNPESDEWAKVATGPGAAAPTLVKDLATRKKLEDQLDSETRSVFNPKRWFGSEFTPEGQGGEADKLKAAIEQINGRIKGGDTTTGTAPSPAAATHVYDPETGTLKPVEQSQ